jgi:hypothetical protein
MEDLTRQDAEGGLDRFSRRRFLRKAGVTSLAGFALAAVGDVLVSPVARAGQRSSAGRATGRLTVYENRSDIPDSCIAYATCNPCGGCCETFGGCTPPEYCFYCTATPCQPAGVNCYHHSKSTFYICCS